jgi:hypothetical protein
MENGEYRLRFADRAQRHLFNGGALTPEAVQARLDALLDQIDLAIIAESARWGDHARAEPYTKDDWVKAVNQIANDFIPRRTQIVIDQLKNVPLRRGPTRGPLYPQVAAPRLGQHGGVVPSGFQLLMEAPGDVDYTTDGSDPRQAAAKVDFTTVLTAKAPARWVVPTDGSLETRWTAVDFDDSAWQEGITGIGFGGQVPHWRASDDRRGRLDRRRRI